MKTCLRVACLVLVYAVLFVGCGPAAATPPATDTAAPSAVTATAVPPSPTQPLTTLPPPTQTPLPTPPAQQLPTDTPPPTFTPVAPISSPVPTLPGLPLNGRWHGGGTNLLVDFLIEAGMISDVGILWQGRDECEVNARYQVQLPLDENGFKMSYNKDDIAFVFYTTEISPELILGVFDLRYRGCGEHTITWRAVPK